MLARAMNLRTAQFPHVAIHNISKLAEPLKRRFRALLGFAGEKIPARPAIWKMTQINAAP